MFFFCLLYYQESALTSRESLTDNMDAVRKKFEVFSHIFLKKNLTWKLYRISLINIKE